VWRGKGEKVPEKPLRKVWPREGQAKLAATKEKKLGGTKHSDIKKAY